MRGLDVNFESGETKKVSIFAYLSTIAMWSVIARIFLSQLMTLILGGD